MTRPLPQAVQPKGPDIGRLIAGVLRRWPIALCLIVAGAISGIWVQRHLPPTYASTVSILLDPKRPGGIAQDGQFASLAIDNTKINTVISVIESASVLRQVVESENLADDPYFGASMPSLMERLSVFAHSWLPVPYFNVPTPAPLTKEEREDLALFRLSKAVTTSRVNFTYVVEVQALAPTAALAQRLAGAVANAYMTYQAKTKRDAIRQDTAWLRQQLTDMRSELIRSEENVEAIRREYNLIETGQGPNSTTDRQTITEMTQQLVNAKADVAAQQAKYELVKKIQQGRGNLESLPEVTSSMTIQQLRSAQTEVARKIADLSARYTPSYSGLIDARRDMKALDDRLSAEIGRIASGIRTSYETAAARQDELTKILTGLVNTTHGDTSSEGRVRLREAERIVEANRAFYDSQLRRLREAELLETRQDVEAGIMSPAALPDAPKFPKRTVFVGLGTVLGGITALGIAVLMLLFEQRVVTSAWIEETLSLEVLGLVPFVNPRDRTSGGQGLTIPFYLRQRPLSHFAETLRALRARLRYAVTSPPRIVHVTSSVPGEGKSVVAAALAASAALAGLRTVLVDLDVRNSSVSNLFNMSASEGIVDALQNDGQIVRATQPVRQLPLTVVPAGPTSRLNPDVIGYPQLQLTIRKLAEEFDFVVLDSPPVLAVSDAALISNVADATLFVIQWRITPKDVIQEAVKVLRSCRAPLAGAVFNKFDFSRAQRYEGKGYHTYYGAVDSGTIA